VVVRCFVRRQFAKAQKPLILNAVTATKLFANLFVAGLRERERTVWH
jgi:hypothetical protein